MDIVELGVDLNSSWDFVNGDLTLVEYNDNLVQAVTNRLNNYLDSMDLFYDEYGSLVLNYLGWKSTDETLNFIRLEIMETLKQDPRCQSFNVTVDYKNGKVNANISIYFNDDTDLSFSVIIGNTGVYTKDDEELD